MNFWLAFIYILQVCFFSHVYLTAPNCSVPGFHSFTNTFIQKRNIFLPVTLNFPNKLDQDSIEVNQQAKYLAHSI